jgi:single-stranded DNA-binding protein
MEAVVDIGLDGWYRISPASRKVVSETLLRSQSWMAGEMGRQHADRVWARVEAHRKQALVCAMLPMKDERNRQRCNAATWK